MSSSVSKEDLKRQKYVFRLNYEKICKANNKNALKGVTCHLTENKLDFLGDRIRLEDWVMIINAIKHDRSLHMIAVRSRYPSKTVLETIDDHDKARKVTKHPLLYTKHVLYNTMHALHTCLHRSRALVCLELEGLPLNGELLEMLLDGVSRCASLSNLSLYRCDIGDEGVGVVCKVLKDLPSIVQLDLSGCGVTSSGAEMIAELLKYQSLQRCGEEWKQSLRYQVPDVDTFPGLRRVTLNHNRHIGDRGAKQVLDTLKDDSWLKALDMQNCGLSNDTAVHAISLLEINRCLNVVDLRANDVSHSLEGLILQALMRNNEEAAVQDGELVDKHEWLELETCLRPRKARSTSRPATPTSSRCHTPVTPHQANAKMAATQRPSTCMPAIRAPLLAVVDTASEARLSVAQSASSFEVDRLREELKEIMMEFNYELTKRVEAEAVNARLQSDILALTTQFDEERQMRLRAEEERAQLDQVLERLEQERCRKEMEKNRKSRITESGDNKNTDSASLFNSQPQRASQQTKKSRSLHGGPQLQTSPRKLKIWSNPRALEEEMSKIFVESKVGDSMRSQCSSVHLDGKSKNPSKATKLFNLLMADKAETNKHDWSRKNNQDKSEIGDGEWYEKEMEGDRMMGKEFDLPEKMCFDKGDATKSEREWMAKRFGENADLNKRISEWSEKNSADNDLAMNAPSESSLRMPTWLSEESDF